MAKTITPKPSPFDFTKAVSQLFTQPGGRNFAIRLILWTSVFMSVLFLVSGMIFVESYSIILESSWLIQQSPEDPTEALEMYKDLIPFIPKFLIAYMVMWLLYASAETALHKRIFLNIDHGFIPLRFGRDELRVMGVQFMVMLMLLGVFLLGFVVIMLLAVLAAGLASVAMALGIIVGVFVFIAYIGMFVYSIYFSIRMAPSAALSIETGVTRVAGGWGITHKRALNLFLAYLFLTIAGYIVVTIVQISVMSLILPDNSMMLVTGYSEENPRILFEQAAGRLKQPLVMLGLIVGGIVYVLVSVTWWLSFAGVGAYAVKWWNEDQGQTGPSVFD